MLGSYQNWQNYFHRLQTPPGTAMCYGNHISRHSRQTVQLVSVSFSHISAFHCILSHCMDESLFAPLPFIKQTEGLFKWLRSTKRDWDDGWGRVEEDRGRSVREGTKTTPSDCRWLFQSLAWIWAFTEISAGLFSGDTGKAFIEWTMMLKWSFHFSLSLWWPCISKASQNHFHKIYHGAKKIT